MISDVFGLSGRRILEAIAGGERDPARLAELGDSRLQCSREVLMDALSGQVEAVYRDLLQLQLKRQPLSRSMKKP